MPKCTDCRFEGSYDFQRPALLVSQAEVESIEMKYMICQAPDGGPTQNPISSREAGIDQECVFFQPAEIWRPLLDETIEIEADSLDKAREQIKTQIPQGWEIQTESIIDDGSPKTIKGFAKTVEEAFEKAEAQIPDNVDILERKEIATFELMYVTLEAVDEQSARRSAQSRAIREGAEFRGLKLKSEGKKGFLGIGKTLNQYWVEFLRMATVEVTYKPRVKLSIKIIESIDTLFKRVRDTQSLSEKVEKEQYVATFQRILRERSSGNPFVTAVDHPLAIVRIVGLPRSELKNMQAAVKQGKVVLVPQLEVYQCYPILSLSFFIYDAPSDPYRTEVLVDIAGGDSQDFLVEVSKKGKGEFRLFDEFGAVSGTFTLIVPSLGTFDKRKVKFPVKLTNKDLINFSLVLRETVNELEKIPLSKRDFKDSVEWFLRENS